MNKHPILHQTDHRPWELPPRPWIMHQAWQELLFMHWALPAEDLQGHIPAPLQLQTYEGLAWLGVVPFRMSQIYPRGLFAVPWLSAFAELNVRTYVTDGEKPGVLFLSLDAANPVGVWLGRHWYNLPYFNAHMTCRAQGDTIHYDSTRTHRGAPPAAFRARYRPVGAVYHSQPGTLEHWLTERYCLYAIDGQGGLRRAEIHHAPWGLQPAEVEIEINDMATCHGITLPDQPPLLHYAHAIEVLVWGLRRL